MECKCGSESERIGDSGEMVWYQCKKCGLYSKWYMGSVVPKIIERTSRPSCAQP